MAGSRGTSSRAIGCRVPECVFSILSAILLAGNGCTRTNIVAYSGYEESSIRRFLGTMTRVGWISKNANLWFVTERGKIVHAVETGRRTKARGCYHYRGQTVMEFERQHASWHQEDARA